MFDQKDELIIKLGSALVTMQNELAVKIKQLEAAQDWARALEVKVALFEPRVKEVKLSKKAAKNMGRKTASVGQI